MRCSLDEFLEVVVSSWSADLGSARISVQFLHVRRRSDRVGMALAMVRAKSGLVAGGTRRVIRVSPMVAFGRWTLLLNIDGGGLGGGEMELCSLVRLGTLCCLLCTLLVGSSVGMSVSSTMVLGEGELEAYTYLQEWPVEKLSPTGSVWVALSVVVDLRAPPLLRRGSRAGLGVSFAE